MSIKNILKILTVKLLITLFCLSCLMYQTYILIEQYLKFKSIINIRFTPNNFDILPAITICYNEVISFEKMAQRYIGYQDIYRNYTNFIKYYSDKKSSMGDETLISQGNNFYWHQYMEILEEYQLQNLDGYPKVGYLRIFDNLSIDLFNDDEKYIKYGIYVAIFADKGPVINHEGYFTHNYQSPPLESLDIKRNSKCYTHFFEKEASYLNMSIIGISFYLGYHSTWFPYDESNSISLAIHPPHVKPKSNSFKNILQNTKNIALFSKVEEKRLIYYDNCREYNKSQNDFQTENDCLFDCILKSVPSKCYYLLKRNIPSILFRKQISKLEINECCCKKLENYFEIVDMCKIECEDDCDQTYYLTSIENLEHLKKIDVKNQPSSVLIQTNSNPNIIIEHFAEIAFISLICNFGGLIGMYLGISIHSVFCHIWDSTKKLFSKLNFFKIKINNVQHNFRPIVNFSLNVNYVNEQNYINRLRRQR